MQHSATPATPHVPFNQALHISVAVYVILFASYLVTAAPVVTLIDCGEFILCARILGNPHSPGYPTFTQAAHGILQIPIGSDAFRLTAFSAFGGALAGALTMLLVTGLTGRRRYGVLAGLSLGWSATYWEQATMVEVYCLALCFGIVLTMLVLAPLLNGIRASGRTLGLTRRMGIAGLVLGLAVGFHHYNIFFLPGLTIAALMVEGRRLFAPQRLCIIAMFMLLGFAGSHAYLPIRAAQHPYYAWEDPQTWTQFKRVVSTENFNHQRWARTWDQAMGFFGNFEDALIDQFTVVTLGSALLGALVMAAGSLFWREGDPRIRRWQVTLIAIGPLWLIDSFLGTFYFNLGPDFYDTLRVFYIPGHWVLVVLAGCGLAAAEAIPTQIPAQTRLIRSLALLACLVLPAMTLAKNGPSADRTDDYFVYDWGKSALLSLPPDGTLIFQSDEGFILWYLQGSLGFRPDSALLFRDVLHTENIRLTNNRWFAEAMERNNPHLKIPNILDAQARFGIIASQTPVSSTYDSREYRLPTATMYPAFPGWELQLRSFPFSHRRYLRQLRRFPLRNPPAGFEDRMTADRDYLDIVLRSAGDAVVMPILDRSGEAEARQAIIDYIEAIDPHFLSLYRPGWRQREQQSTSP